MPNNELESSAPSAAEPVAIPDLTPEQLADKCEAWLSTGTLTTNVVDAYEAGYRDCEAAHAVAFSRQSTQSAAEPVALEACKKFVDGFSMLDDGPDDSDVRHAKCLLVEAVELARAAIAAPPAPAPSAASEREALTDEQWYDLAQRHANRDWNSDGYLSSIKAVCSDFAALHSTGKPDGEVAK